MTSYPADLAARVYDKLTNQGVKSPSVDKLRDLFEVMYFASLKTEEGKPVQFSITYSNPHNPDPKPPPRIRAYRWKHISLDPRKLLTVRNVSKLARAVDPWTSSLAVYAKSDGRLEIWGLIDQMVHFNTFLVRESDAGLDTPGLFQAVVQGPTDITIYRGYNFIARLNQASIISQQKDVFGYGPVSRKIMRDVPRLERDVAKSLRMTLARCLEHWDETENRLGTLCRILVSIQRYRHGGAVLISPTTNDLNLKYAVNYDRLSRALRGLAMNQVRFNMSSRFIHEEYMGENEDSLPMDLYLDSAISEDDLHDAEAEVTGCVRFVSALSCVDGLVHLQPDFTIDGFGAEITLSGEVRNLFRASGAQAKSEGLTLANFNHYGMRHRSMMRFCDAHPESVGFVISQDGDIRAITRVDEKLVMWENIMVQHFWDAYMRRWRTKTSE